MYHLLSASACYLRDAMQRQYSPDVSQTPSQGGVRVLFKSDKYPKHVPRLTYFPNLQPF